MNYSYTYMDVQAEVKAVEKELVELIIAHLKANRIAVETARQQAQDFLSLLPIDDQRDLLGKLKGLGQKYEEAKQIYAEELGKINEAMRQRTLDQMRGFIQTGNIEAAIGAAKAMYPNKKPEGEFIQPVGLEHTAVLVPESVQPTPPASTAPAPPSPAAAQTESPNAAVQPAVTPAPQPAQPSQSVQQPVAPSPNVAPTLTPQVPPQEAAVPLPQPKTDGKGGQV